MTSEEQQQMSCFTRIQIKSAMSTETNADVEVPPTPPKEMRDKLQF